jgi:transposase-like protein
MQQKKMNLIEFQRIFSTEEACEEHLFKLRWPDGYKCPRCGHEKYYYHSTRHLYQCSKCRYQVSVTAGTVFHKTRTSLIKWFWMIFLMGRQKSGVSMMSLQRMLEIKSYKTVWMMGHKIRHGMLQRDSYYKLAGLIEMDDTYIGYSKHGKQGRGAEGKAKVIVAVKNKDGKPGYMKMQKVDDMSKKSINDAFNKRLCNDVKFRTDGWVPYRVLKTDQREHEIVVVGSYGDKAIKALPWVHTMISNIKGNLRGIYHGVSPKHLDRYLSEFCFRFNRRLWEKQMFDRILNACLNYQTITYAELSL